MSFSFPHLVWIFQKAFSGLSYFETLIWLMIDVVTIGLLPLGLLDVDSEYGELHCEQFYPSCCFFHIDIPNWDIIIWHIWNNEVRCWGYVTHGGWWYLVIQLIPQPDSLHSHSDIFFHTFSNHSGIWTLSRCPVTIPDPNPHPHIPKREASSPQFSLSSFTLKLLLKACTPTATFSFLIFLCFTASLYTQIIPPVSLQSIAGLSI